MRAYAHNLHLILPARTSVRRTRGKHREAAEAIPQERLVIQFPQSQKRRLRITPGLCSRSSDRFCYFTRVRLADVEKK
jgi:hypothetical protein